MQKINILIKPEIIQRIIETSRIDEVVGDFVSLRKKGSNLMGLCPFHNEKTPSFTVSPTKNIYKCFGCGKAGNSINFIMEHENYSYIESIKYLANKYNIEVEETEITPELIALQSERELLYNISKFAQKYFSETLFNTEEGKNIALSYFFEREFTQETIEKYQLGYSPANWDSFTSEAKRNGYNIEHLVKSGLTIENEGKYYDRFRERVIFPIHNLTGRVIGFGGRILNTTQSKAKYINSPESEIYHKSNVLYGLYFAKNKIVSEDNCYLVEGYTDVISMHQAGILNVVSSSGTSLTIEQIRLIKKFTSNITIIYDADNAGIKASFRGIDLVLQEDLNIRVVLLPESEDPDSFVRKNRTSDSINYFKNNAQNFIIFKTSLLLKDAKDDPILKSKIVTDIVSDISLIPNNITREFFIKECAKLFEISEKSLINQLNKVVAQKIKKDYYRTQSYEDDNIDVNSEKQEEQFVANYYDPEPQEKAIIELILNFGNNYFDIEMLDENNMITKNNLQIANFVINSITEDELTFDTPLYNIIFNEIVENITNQNFDIQKHFINHHNADVSLMSVNMIATKYNISPNWEKYNIERPSIYENELKIRNNIIETLYSFKIKKIEIMIFNIDNNLKKADNEQEFENLLIQKIQLNKIKNIFCEKLSYIITH